MQAVGGRRTTWTVEFYRGKKSPPKTALTSKIRDGKNDEKSKREVSKGEKK